MAFFISKSQRFWNWKLRPNALLVGSRIPPPTSNRNVTTGQRLLENSATSLPAVRGVGEGISVVETRHGKYLRWDALQSRTRPLDVIFLRDMCSCPRCVNNSSGQKQFDTAAIPLEIDVRKATHSSTGALHIEWINDVPGFEEHTTILQPQIWQQNATFSTRQKAAFETKTTSVWSKEDISRREGDIWYEFDDYMSSDRSLNSFLQTLTKFGLAFIRNVPDSSSAVVSMSHRIGPLQNTFYGSTWDVKARPMARNVAYTANSLGFHMDLLYMKDPPYLQFLHCLRQSAHGGESLFSDTLNAVYRIQHDQPDIAASMWQCPITYRYKNAGKYYQYTRPMLEGPGMMEADVIYREWIETRKSTFKAVHEPHVGLTWGRHFQAVNWSPPFQGPFMWDIGEYSSDSNSHSTFRKFIQVAKLFQETLESQENVYEIKLKAGDCVVFDNRRVVHARKAFHDASGERWLKGSYVDSNSFNSRRRALEAGLQDLCPTGIQG